MAGRRLELIRASSWAPVPATAPRKPSPSKPRSASRSIPGDSSGRSSLAWEVSPVLVGPKTAPRSPRVPVSQRTVSRSTG